MTETKQHVRPCTQSVTDEPFLMGCGFTYCRKSPTWSEGIDEAGQVVLSGGQTLPDGQAQSSHHHGPYPCAEMCAQSALAPTPEALFAQVSTPKEVPIVPHSQGGSASSNPLGAIPIVIAVPAEDP